MKQFNVSRLMWMIILTWVVVLSLGFWFGWVMNNLHNQDREATRAKLADTQRILNDTLAKLASSRTDCDFYRSQYENGQAPSQAIRIIYRGNLKATVNNSGPEDAWKEFEIARSQPIDGTIYISDIGELAEYARHDAKINDKLLAKVIDQSGSYEESGPGR